MRLVLGKGIRFIGMASYWIFGFVGFLFSLAIVSHETGFWGFVAAFVLLPVTFVAAPWYALVKWGNWWPLIFTYGGVIVAAGLVALGTAVIPRNEKYIGWDR